MAKTLSRLLVGSPLLWIVLPHVAWAQAGSTSIDQRPDGSEVVEKHEDRSPGGEVELRLGGVAVGQGYGTKMTAGGRFGLFLGKRVLGRRLGVHIVGDSARLSEVDGTLPYAPGLTRTSTYWFAVGPMLGFDLVRSSRFALDLRAGAVWDVNETRFALEGDDTGGDPYTTPDGFVDACGLVAFKERCYAHVRFTGAVAVGGRVWPQSAKPWFVGVDYGWNGAGRRQLAATIGFGRQAR